MYLLKTLSYDGTWRIWEKYESFYEAEQEAEELVNYGFKEDEIQIVEEGKREIKYDFVIAFKEICPLTGEIAPGRTLGKYETIESAEYDIGRLAKRECEPTWKIGIFHNGKLIN